MGPDGRVEVHTINPDGGRIDSSFSSDGSGRTDILDAGGNIDKSIPVRPDPRPVPLGGHEPEKFIDNAHKELGPDVPIDPPDFTGEAAGFAAAPLSEAEVEFLSERGIVPPGDPGPAPLNPPATDVASAQPPSTGAVAPVLKSGFLLTLLCRSS